MSNTSPLYIDGNIGAIFARLNQQNIEEFNIGYQCWSLQHQIEGLQIHLEDLRKQIIVNTERIQAVQPTAVELATLARLQSNGVSDVDLLDRMLERGEWWLDRTMQRLDYFEQLDDFISDDYTQWCQHALEGAYDWIDSVLDGNVTSPPSTETTSATTQDMKEEELIEATEELFLQKISNDEDESLMQAITMKRASITIADLEEAVPSSEDTRAEVEVAPSLEHTPSAMEETNLVDTTSVTNPPTEEVTIPGHEAVEAVPMQEPVEISPVARKSSTSSAKSTLAHVSPKRSNFMKRFFGKVWGS